MEKDNLTTIKVGKKSMHIVAVAIICPTCWLGVCFCYVNKKTCIHRLIPRVKHEDSRSYTATDGSPRQRYGNVYYHLKLSCITAKQPQINPARLVVFQVVMERARQAHSDYRKTMLEVSLATNNRLEVLSLFFCTMQAFVLMVILKHFHASGHVSTHLHSSVAHWALPT